MKLTVDLQLTPAQLAAALCDLDDEQQAQVFIEAARIAQAWPSAVARTMQWWSVGKHLATCACSTEEARDLVRDIAAGVAAGAERAA